MASSDRYFLRRLTDRPPVAHRRTGCTFGGCDRGCAGKTHLERVWLPLCGGCGCGCGCGMAMWTSYDFRVTSGQGAGVATSGPLAVTISDTAFRANEAPKGASLSVTAATTLRITNTTIDEPVDESSTAVWTVASSVAMCGDNPCEPGSQCTFKDFSTFCEGCGENEYGENGIACDACRPGTQPDDSNTQCLPCEPGSITNVSGASTCTWCRPGKSSGAENTSCIDCVPGTYSNPPVTPLCTRCATNTFSNASNATLCSKCSRHKFTRRAEEWVNVTGGMKFVWNDTTGATICSDCPSIVVIPTYMKYADVDKPPVRLCKSSTFRAFCSPSERNTTDVYINGKSVVHEQEIPMGCPINMTAVTDTANRTSILCGQCGDVDAAGAVAGAVSAAVGAAVGAAAAAGGANPALIDQIQFMAIVGNGVCASLVLICSSRALRSVLIVP